jgi:predicted porin
MNHVTASLAVGLLFTAAAGAASAQSGVTVYGILDAGITRETGGADGAVTKLASGVQSGSRIGFKGQEDLGNGISAHFVLVNGLDLDTGKARQNGALFGRDAYVGLTSSVGTINLGRQCNPIFIALDGIDPFETGFTGASTNLMSIGTARTDNTVSYATPKLNGLSATVMVGLGEKAGDSSLGRTLAFSIDYAAGPWVAALAYDSLKVTSFNTMKEVLLGASYNFGPLTVHAAFETEKDDIGSDFRDYLLGASVPLGQGKLLASYVKKQDRAATQRGGRQLAVGYTYALSKRTNLYSSFGAISNELAATNMVGDASSGGSAPAAGDGSRALALGIRHKF